MRAMLFFCGLSIACEKELEHDEFPPEEQTLQTPPVPVVPPVKQSTEGKSVSPTKTTTPQTVTSAETSKLIEALASDKTAQESLQKLVTMKDAAIPALLDPIRKNENTIMQGWALKGLSQIDSQASHEALERILQDPNYSTLIRTWTAAALLAQAKDLKSVLKLAPLIQQYPPLQRPAKMKIEAFKDSLKDIDQALGLASKNNSLQEILSPIIIKLGPHKIITAMLSHSENSARRLAAGYLAGMARTDADVIKKILEAFQYQKDAKQVPWAGGALYVPSAQWSKKSAQKLVGHLISWLLYCERNRLKTEQQKIHQNLRSVGLIRAAGFTTWRLPRDIDGILVAWGQLAGPKSLKQMLKDHKLHKVDHYQKILNRISSEQ